MTEQLSLDQRIRRLEDRVEIAALATRYAAAVDAADWPQLRDLFTDIVHVDFSEAGLPPQDFPRDEFIAFARQGLEGWDARQHLSTNHDVVFDPADASGDRATLHSYMFAQHHAQGAPTFVMHGSYDHDVVRTADGWRIRRLVQHVFWMDAPPAAMTSN
jgi:3-phenylpropionate/cinnamic acid dioxygenase small subunit